MIYDLRFTIRRLALLCALCASVAKADVYNGVYADTNNNILPGFYISSTQVVGTVLSASIPANVITTSNTNLSAFFTNTVNGAWSQLTTNGHFKFVDEYKTTNDFTTNGFTLIWTNGNSFVVSNGAVRFSGLGAGNGAGFTNLQLVNFSNWPAISNACALNYTNAFTPFSNSIVVFTNWITTNSAAQINSASNTVTTNLTAAINSTYITLLNLVNADAASWQAASNNIQATNSAATAGVQTYAVGVSNNVVTSSNALRTAINTVSNTVAAITSSKAFTATVPATYGSIGIGFSTPLMPDGNYSVTLLPQDQNTAQSPATGLFWWVGSKNASGFTIYLSYATNGYNLNFDTHIKENTQ